MPARVRVRCRTILVSAYVLKPICLMKLPNYSRPTDAFHPICRSVALSLVSAYVLIFLMKMPNYSRPTDAFHPICRRCPTIVGRHSPICRGIDSFGSILVRTVLMPVRVRCRTIPCLAYVLKPICLMKMPNYSRPTDAFHPICRSIDARCVLSVALSLVSAYVLIFLMKMPNYSRPTDAFHPICRSACTVLMPGCVFGVALSLVSAYVLKPICLMKMPNYSRPTDAFHPICRSVALSLASAYVLKPICLMEIGCQVTDHVSSVATLCSQSSDASLPMCFQPLHVPTLRN
ncbi:hypothetical protein J6590_001620 [Homalodisca vitripennis]|nr:hypothetical protein J6590_001620 [Homalodisca vitripennis]